MARAQSLEQGRRVHPFLLVLLFINSPRVWIDAKGTHRDLLLQSSSSDRFSCRILFSKNTNQGTKKRRDAAPFILPEYWVDRDAVLLIFDFVVLVVVLCVAMALHVPAGRGESEGLDLGCPRASLAACGAAYGVYGCARLAPFAEGAIYHGFGLVGKDDRGREESRERF